MRYKKRSLKRENRRRNREEILKSLNPATAPNSHADPAASIGMYLQRHETKEAFCASDRIRGERIVKNSPRMELFDAKNNYEVVIFHVPCRAISQYGRVKILDICDRVWESNVQEFIDLIAPIDAIVVPTEALKSEVAEVTDKHVHVIGDGHDFSHYMSIDKKNHLETAKEVVWFGYSENAECLVPFMDYIKSSGLKLRVVTQHQNTKPLGQADEFVKWDISTYLQEITKADFALLPPNKGYKSNNKEITALLCGIPVAKTIEDISRLMDPVERRMEMETKTKEIAAHDSRDRTAEYLRVIDGIKKKSDPIHVYSAICGRFDKPRGDIQVFSDRGSDMFKLPVMNAKIYKVLSHKYVNAPFSIFLDGNIFLNVPAPKLVSDMLEDADIALFKHPWRGCIYQEHAHAKGRVPAAWQPMMDEQVANYRREGMPADFGLGECGMLIRRNNDVIAEFNERWWAEICRYTNRDQMSFPYVLWKMGGRIKVRFIDGNVRKHPYFKYISH